MSDTQARDEQGESVHECDWCLHELPCVAIGPLWICGDCEFDRIAPKNGDVGVPSEGEVL